MKFVCDRCHTRYNISDEKVKGKVLKVRCKTCGNIIVVREQGAESAVAVAAAGGSRGPAPRTEVDMGSRKTAPPARPNIEWFVAIKGKQHGPMSHGDVADLFRSGKIHPRSYCWHEDLAGWTRLRELPDFDSLLNEDKPSTPSSPPGPPPEEDRGAEVVSLDAHRQQREAQTAPVPAAKDDPFAIAAAAAGATPGAPLAEGAPRESTRVFIMNAGLHNRDKKHRTYAVIAVVATVALGVLGYLDYSGTVRIPILSTVNEKIASVAGDEKKLAAIKLQKFEDIAGEMSEAEAAYMRCKLAGDGCPPEKRKRLKRRYERSQGGNDDVDLDGAFNSGPDGKGKIARKDGTADVNFGGIESTGVSGLLGGRDGPSGPKVRLPKAQTIAVSGSELTGEQISKVVNLNKASIQKCIESAAKNAGGELKTAKRKLVLVIGTNGKVKSSRIAHGPTNASDLGACINRRARRWVFPAASKETEVEIPLILTTSF